MFLAVANFENDVWVLVLIVRPGKKVARNNTNGQMDTDTIEVKTIPVSGLRTLVRVQYVLSQI